MNTLVVYASKYGCTEKCAKLIADELTEKVDLINLRKAKDINLSGYDRVIIGGPIYMGKIQKKVTEFCNRHRPELKDKQVGLFVCGMAEGEDMSTELNKSFPAELLKTAKAKEFLGGEFLLDNMNFIDRMILKKIVKITSDKSNISTERIHEFVQAMN